MKGKQRKNIHVLRIESWFGERGADKTMYLMRENRITMRPSISKIEYHEVVYVY